MKCAKGLPVAIVALLFAPLLLAQSTTTVTIDANAPTTPFPHFWEQMFGSGHAILSLREAYRDDLRAVKGVTDFQWVRAHGILDDEVGFFTRDDHGNPVYNIAYIDEIYDGLLRNHVRPVVELSFMPTALAFNPLDLHVFWYHPNVSPPHNMDEWDAMIAPLARHLVDRYGIDEVAQWYFEVWNEPNIDFWAGEPKQATYFELYDHTARALKEVSPKLRVGGPATAAAHWIPEFLNHVNSEHVPVDFVSTHGYADDTVQDLFGTQEDIPMRDRVCRAVKKVHDEIGASPLSTLPLLWTEWNVPSYGELDARDNWYVGPALARDISECDGQVQLMSWWTFDDVFEEGGVKKEPFDGGFGLIAPDRIKKPSFYNFSLLHELGDERIDNSADDVLVTRRKDGAFVVAAWNLVDMDQRSQGTPVTLRLNFKGVAAGAAITIQRVDETHGNPMTAYKAMGSPRYPTQAQIKALNAASTLPAPEHRKLSNGALELTLPVNGLAVLEIGGR